MQEQKNIEECLAGDIDAFAPLVRKYQSQIIAMAQRLLGDEDEAHDAAQEALVQAFKNLHRFDRGRSFKTWIMGIVVKRSLDRLRKRNSFLKFFAGEGRRMPSYHQPQNMDIQESALFRPYLKILKPKEYLAIVMDVNDGYSSREIGEVLECSQSTVRVHQFNARKKLKRALMEAEKKSMLKTTREVVL
jgi:RNA polymerase sigma-70 factor (ECF subfamily)